MSARSGRVEITLNLWVVSASFFDLPNSDLLLPPSKHSFVVHPLRLDVRSAVNSPPVSLKPIKNFFGLDIDNPNIIFSSQRHESSVGGPLHN